MAPLRETRRVDLGQFYKPFIEYQKWEGKTWGLPSWGWTGVDGLLYNSQLAEAAGVTFPAQNAPDWTMNKLYELVVKIGKFIERTNGFGMTTGFTDADRAQHHVSRPIEKADNQPDQTIEQRQRPSDE